MHDDRHSEFSDVSINTDVKVFKGGISKVKDGNNNKFRDNNYNNKSKDNYKNKNNAYKIAHSKSAKIKSAKNINSKKAIQSLNNLPNNNNFTQPNHTQPISIQHTQELDGMISFRSIRNDNFSNPNAVASPTPFSYNEDAVDSNIISSTIITKLGSMNKVVPKGSGMSLSTKYENDMINRVFLKADKKPQNQEIEKELKNFEDEEQDSAGDIEEDVDDSHDYEDNDDPQERIETIPNTNVKEDQQDNIFLNLRSNVEENASIDSERKRSKSLLDNKAKSIKSKSSPYVNNTSEHDKTSIRSSNKDKHIHSIICTLSRIERGKAIFVSSDDFIFLLPASFVPKNLIVGNTYIFKISEFEKFKKKVSNVNEIQKKYIKKNVDK